MHLFRTLSSPGHCLASLWTPSTSSKIKRAHHNERSEALLLLEEWARTSPLMKGPPYQNRLCQDQPHDPFRKTGAARLAHYKGKRICKIPEQANIKSDFSDSAPKDAQESPPHSQTLASLRAQRFWDFGNSPDLYKYH